VVPHPDSLLLYLLILSNSNKALWVISSWEGFPGGILFWDTMPRGDTVGELVGAESGSLPGRQGSEVRRSRFLCFSSCYKVIYTNKIDSSSNQNML
jgi:H+/Cl- antiporter ClcA